MKIKDLFYDSRGQLKIEGLKDGYFISGLVIKVLLGALFASNFLTHLFAPFVNYFVSQGFANPYKYFVDHNQSDAFPYPALMLYILAVPRLLLSPFFSGDFQHISFIDIFTVRLAVLAADFTILCVLLKWLKGHSRKVIIFYWLSPVLIYINYLHGQLDAIPIALLFVSIYFLFRERFLWASLFIALAISAKTNILMVIPFFVIYGMRSRYITRKVLWIGLLSLPVIFLLLNLPFIFSGEFISMVFQNAQQVKIYNAFYDLGGSVVFYFVPAVYFALLLQFINFKAYNRDIFLMFLGFSFGILTLFIVPMQGWYYWIMPFFVYFFVRQISYAQHSFSYSFIALSILYLLFFFLIPQSDFTQIFQIVSPAIAAKSNLFHHFQSHGIDILRLVDVVFSVLQTCLLLCCIWIYTLGIRSNFKLKIQYQPYLIGVGGDSGAGKSTFAKLMEQVFQKKNISVIRGDDMHKWERGDTNWNEFTHLNPKANNLHEDMLHTASLKKGERIDRRHYDHNVGKFTLPEAVQSNKIVIFEGLHPFYLSKQSDIYDLKIFIRPQEELRVHWKVVRDMQKRGYTKDQVLQQLQKREEDSNKYIKVQEERANIIISFCLRTPLADLGNADEHADIFLRFRFDNNINVDPLLNALQQEASLDIRHDYDGDHQEFDLYGNVEAALIARLADEFIPELPDIGIVRPKWQAGYSGLIQLFTVYHIFYKMKIESL